MNFQIPQIYQNEKSMLVRLINETVVILIAKWFFFLEGEQFSARFL